MTTAYRSAFAYYHAMDEGANTQPESVYFDSAATSQRLQASLDTMEAYHSKFNANVHRGGYELAQKATAAYEAARASIAEFLGAQQSNQIVFTSGATAALNLVANGLSKHDLNGKKIVVCISEHHANLLPWQQLAKRFGLQIDIAYVNATGQFSALELDATISCIDENTALVAFAHVSNVLGNIYPVKRICEQARKMQAISVIDGTQAAAHIPIDVTDIDCDFYVISGHKMYASTGIGVLYGKFARLEALSPSIFGGEMIKEVTLDNFELQDPPLKFEAGTPNIAGALGLAAATQFCKQNQAQLHAFENSLYETLLNGLNEIQNITLWGNIQRSIPLVSFSIKGVHAFDLANALAHRNVSVRAGYHCAMPLLQYLKIEGCLRVSLACYNTHHEVEHFLRQLNNVIEELSPGASSDATLQANENVSLKSHMIADIHIGEKEDLHQTSTIESKLLGASNWNEKHRLLLLHSKKLPILTPELRTQYNEVKGCEASVWLNFDEKNKLFSAYSDSKVVRGLLSLLLNKSNCLLALTSDNIDYFAYLEKLGLTRYFSQGRKDGITQVIQRINTLIK